MLWIAAPNNLNTKGAFEVRIFIVHLNGGISIELKSRRINALAYSWFVLSLTFGRLSYKSQSFRFVLY